MCQRVLQPLGPGPVVSCDLAKADGSPYLLLCKASLLSSIPHLSSTAVQSFWASYVVSETPELSLTAKHLIGTGPPGDLSNAVIILSSDILKPWSPYGLDDYDRSWAIVGTGCLAFLAAA
ncbi:hypothetical protein Tco_0180951 [Tanacetum coccineum]